MSRLVAIGLVVLWGCSGDKGLAGSGSVTTNGLTVAAVDPQGTPVLGARIRIRPVDYLAGLPADSSLLVDAVTDASGCISIPSPGSPISVEIDVVRNGTSLSSWRRIEAHARQVSIDTLKPSARLEVSMDGPAAPGLLARVVGLERVVSVDLLGRFALDPMPAGSFEIEVFRPPSDSVVLRIPTGVLAAGDTLPLRSGWELVYQDRFEGNSLDRTRWVADTGTGNNGWGASCLHTFTSRPENVSIQNGSLFLIARQESLNGLAYTSGSVQSIGRRTFTYGRFEVRARMPAHAQGLWTQISMMPADKFYGAWPLSGSLDLVVQDFNQSDSFTSQLHYDRGQGYKHPRHLDGGSRLHDSTHLYALEWTPDSLVWYFDQRRVFAQAGGAPFDKPFYLQLRFAVGGTVVGVPPIATTWPETLRVDDVRVYRKR